MNWNPKYSPVWQWVCAHAGAIFAAVVAWCAYHPRPWWQYAAVPLYGAAYGFANAPRRRSARPTHGSPMR